MFRNEILSHPRLAQLAVPATLLAAGLGLTADHDLLTINGRGGHDRLDDSGLAPNTIGLAFNQ